MIVDSTGRFQTQRWCQRLALVNTQLVEGGVRLWTENGSDVVASRGAFGPATSAVFDDRVVAQACNPEADSWVTGLLGEPGRLFYFPDDGERRKADPNDFPGPVAFPDLSPILLIGQDTLDDLNTRLDVPIPMNRFRPNLVVAGSAAYLEDEWSHFSIGATTFDVLQRCVRCRIPTIDQDTAEASKEPTRTLATYRKTEDGVVFGVNVAHTAAGELEVGTEVVAVESGSHVA